MGSGFWESAKRIVGAAPKRPALGMDVGLVAGGEFVVLLRHGELLPASVTERFSTQKDGMKSLPIWLKGRIPVGGLIQPLQQYLVEDLVGGPARSAQIDVTITVQTSGVVRVESFDHETSRHQSAEIGSVEVVMVKW